MTLEMGKITDVPDVVSPTIFFHVAPSELSARDQFAKPDRFQHRAVAGHAAAHVVEGLFYALLIERFGASTAVNVPPLVVVAARTSKRFERSAWQASSQRYCSVVRCGDKIAFPLPRETFADALSA